MTNDNLTQHIDELGRDLCRARKALIVALANAAPPLERDGRHIEPLIELASALSALGFEIDQLRTAVAS
jgi:predicted ATPase